MPAQIDQTDDFAVGAPILMRLSGKLDHNIRLCSALSRHAAQRFYNQNGFARASIQFSHSLTEGIS